MLTARSLDEVEPRLRALLGLVDGSEQTRRVLDFVIAYAASVGRGAVQLKEKQSAVQYPTRTASPLKRILAVIDDTGRTSRVLDYVIGYAASVGPVEAVVLDVHPEPIIAPRFPQAMIQTPSIGELTKRVAKSASRRLNHLGIVHKTRVEIGDPALTIIRCAKEEVCDMIVINDPNPGVAAGKLAREMANSEGSVSQRVAHLAEVPVVIAK
jgi:nucleotide-binding universal stress UspA family protein